MADPDRRTLKERGRIAGGSLKYMRTLAPVPPVSLATTLVPPGRACFAQESFAGPDTGDQRATREISWRLAVVGKAMAEAAYSSNEAAAMTLILKKLDFMIFSLL